MNCLLEWPEPIVRVQSLSDSGIKTVPFRYIRPPTDRPVQVPILNSNLHVPPSDLHDDHAVNIPVINLATDTWLDDITQAGKEWGFFQVINHGVRPELMDQAREVWRGFFKLPVEVKQRYANNPQTYEGYGSRLGVEKGAILDWSDYYFLQYLPASIRNHDVWPAQPDHHREVTQEYLEELLKLGDRIMHMLAVGLGLDSTTFYNAFGGAAHKDSQNHKNNHNHNHYHNDNHNDNGGVAACIRVNFYPKCPQPDLTLGLSPHSDPGGLTILLPDPDVAGLQVRKDRKWVTVKPQPYAFIVNLGDQMQVVSNAIYRSVEHRVVVNSDQERLSLAFFYNPRGDLPLEPVKELVTPDRPALYKPMTYNEYRLHIRMKGPQGKHQVESLKSTLNNPR